MKKLYHDLLIRFMKVLNILLMTVPFGICWFVYFADLVKNPFYRRGNYVVIAFFLIFYYAFGKIYEAFNVSMKPVSEVVYSQSLASLASGAVMVMITWLLTRHFPSLKPFLLCFAANIVISMVWSFVCNRIYYKVFPPKLTAVVYDQRRGMEDLIHEYGLAKKYDVKLTLDSEHCLADLEQLKGLDVVFLSGVHSKQRNVILKYCMYHDIEVMVIPRIGDVILSGAKPIHMFHLPMLDVKRYNATPEYLFVKRLMDIVISLAALIILSPIMLITGIAIKCYDGGPAFYKQIRLTKDGKQFYIHKFRSMRVDAEKDGVARLSTGEHDSRITPIGRFIRKVRLDELPQLIDILAGSLSLVGPRPERPEIAAQYYEEMPEFALRLQAKAGLTGYAQVYGKYNTTPYDKLQMDLMYIAHPSILEDLKIMMATVKILFMPDSTEGVEEGQTTAAK